MAKSKEQRLKGRDDEAEKTLRKLADQNPTSAEAQAALTQLLMDLNKVDDAAVSAKRAVEVSGAGPAEGKAAALATMASLDLLRGSAKDAVKNAQEAATLAPTGANLAVLSRAQVRAQDPAALQTAEKAVQAGASAPAHAALGEAQLAAGKAADAAASFRKAVELDAKYTPARVGLANSLSAQGKGAEAVAEAKKATEADPNSGAAFAAHGLAILAENKANAAAALNEAGQASFLAPRNAAVQVQVGRIFEQAGNLDQAVAAFKKALEADPDYVPARVSLVQGLIYRGKTDEALPEAEKLAKAYPNNGEAQLMYGRLLLQKSEFVQAVQPLTKASESLPGSAEAHAFLGTALQYSGDSAGALEAYRKAVAGAPGNASYRSTYGLLLGIADKYDEAVKELTQVVNSPNYKDTAGWTNLGWVYRNMEPTSKPEEAVKAYTKALELDAKNAQAALGLGWAYSFSRKYDEAINAFQKAVSLEPKTAAEANNGIAWCFYFKNDLPKAKEFAAKAKEAGRNVAGLLQNIDRKEKAPTQAQADDEAAKAFRQEQRAKEAPDVHGIGQALMRGAPAGKMKAARDLVPFGRAAVQYLVFAAVNDPSFDVRGASIQSLGAIGGNAREACPQLKQIQSANPFSSTISDKQTMEKEVAYDAVMKAARGAMRSIGCN
ncbi:MAG TPA: tetratricopeptide repeat protein [Vicinamibacteria bacterium]